MVQAKVCTTNNLCRVCANQLPVFERQIVSVTSSKFEEECLLAKRNNYSAH